MSSTPQEQGIIFEQKKKEKRRILIMAALLGICCALTYYFHVVLGVGTVFTHFFYVPIILASLWWRRKGLVVAVFLALMLIFSHFFITLPADAVNDLIRAPLFIVVALAVTVLSERIAEAEVKLKDYAKELEKVVEERNYTRHLIESSPDFQMTLGKGGKIMDVNESFVHVVGKRREDIIGTSVYQYLPTEATEKAVAEIFAKGNVRDIELTADIPGKGTIICNFSGTVFTTPEGESGIYATGRDITERKRAEEALDELRRYRRELIEASLDPLVVISAEGMIIDVNHATELVTGYPREKLRGSNFSDYFTDPQKARQGYQQVFREGHVYDYPLEIKHRDGKVTPVLYNASVYRDAQGGVAGVFAVARDITERKKVEEEREALLKDIGETNRKLAERAKELEESRRATLNMAVDIEKTKQELQESMTKLERFNRLAVDRELKMIELKKEVNRLCERLGEKPRFDISFVDDNKITKYEIRNTGGKKENEKGQ